MVVVVDLHTVVLVSDLVAAVAVELWLLATTQQIPCPSLGLEALL